MSLPCPPSGRRLTRELGVVSNDFFSTRIFESGSVMPGSPSRHMFCFSFLTFQPSRFLPLNGSMGFVSAAWAHASRPMSGRVSRKRTIVGLGMGKAGGKLREVMLGRGVRSDQCHRVRGKAD